MSELLHHKVEEALKATEAFSAVLDEETAALKASDYTTFEKLQDKKIQLAERYQDSVLAFEQEVDFLKGLADAIKDKLRVAHARFKAAAEANQQALDAARKVAERIVGLIMDAAKRAVVEAPNYGAGALQTVSEKIPLSFKVNEVL